MTEEEEEAVDFHMDMLESKDEQVVAAAIMFLGTIAAKSLQTFGTSTIFSKEDGSVWVPNPLHVFLHPDADPERPKGPMKFVRPILGEPVPRYIDFKDGQPWVVTIEEDESGDDTPT